MKIGELKVTELQTIDGKIDVSAPTKREYKRFLKNIKREKTNKTACIVGKVENGRCSIQAAGNGLAMLAIYAVGIRGHAVQYGVSTQDTLNRIKEMIEKIERSEDGSLTF